MIENGAQHGFIVCLRVYPRLLFPPRARSIFYPGLPGKIPVIGQYLNKIDKRSILKFPGILYFYISSKP